MMDIEKINRDLITDVNLVVMERLILLKCHLSKDINHPSIRISVQYLFSLRDKDSWFAVEVNLNQSVHVHFHEGNIFEFIFGEMLLGSVFSSILFFRLRDFVIEDVLFAFVDNKLFGRYVLVLIIAAFEEFYLSDNNVLVDLLEMVIEENLKSRGCEVFIKRVIGISAINN